MDSSTASIVDSSAFFGLVIGDKTAVHFDGSIYTASIVRTVVEDLAVVHAKSNISLLSRSGSGCFHATACITCNCAAIHDEVTICRSINFTIIFISIYVNTGTFATGNNTAVHGKCSPKPDVNTTFARFFTQSITGDDSSG